MRCEPIERPRESDGTFEVMASSLGSAATRIRRAADAREGRPNSMPVTRAVLQPRHHAQSGGVGGNTGYSARITAAPASPAHSRSPRHGGQQRGLDQERVRMVLPLARALHKLDLAAPLRHRHSITLSQDAGNSQLMAAIPTSQGQRAIRRSKVASSASCVTR